MSLRRLSFTELIAIAGGLLLAFGLFQNWYDVISPRGILNEVRGQRTWTGFEAHEIQRWFYVVAAVAPLILAYIVVRGHTLAWARGELTAVISIFAFGLILYTGVIDRPGEPTGAVTLAFGWYVATAGLLLMLVGAALRSSSNERPRKPPGVL